MYYHLLTVKARDKAYLSHTSDSLILSVLRYYERRNDKKHLPEAYYYAGRVCADLQDAPQALGYYQKAADLLEGNTDYRLITVAYSQMGELFLYQDVYEEALKAYRKAYQYAAKLEDRRGMVINLCKIGSTFTGLNNADSALYYYQEALRQAERQKDKSMLVLPLNRIVDLYEQLEEYDSAWQALQRLIQLPSQNQSTILANIADFYYCTNNLDSASSYCQQLLTYDDIYIQQSAHWKLANIAQKQSDVRRALEHLQYYHEYTDSIKKITDSENIRKLQSLYNYQLREKENGRLKVANARQTQWIVCAIFILALLVAIYIAHIQYSLRKRNLLRRQVEKLEQLKEEQYRQSTAFIEDNRRKIESLEHELLTRQKDNVTMRQLLLAQKEQILQMNCKVEADRKERNLAEIALRQSDIYNKFHQAAKDDTVAINNKDWEQLSNKIDLCFNDFTKCLRAFYPISDIDMKICLLLKIDINVTGISSLIHRSKSTVVSARKKMYEKTHGEAGKPEQWDAFINSL